MLDRTIIDSVQSLSEGAQACLEEADPARKCTAVAALSRRHQLPLGKSVRRTAPGRPSTPMLVHPRDLPRRRLTTPEGHAAFVHAICHIEFTAINLALDAVVSFTDLPAAFFTDWISVAAEEAIHFSLLNEHLHQLGFKYGAFDAHDGLWDMAERTADDVLRRMALVPRVMEARGLDVTPDMIVRLREIQDVAGASILQRILSDEIRHVAIGSRWFEYVCSTRKLDPVQTFIQIVESEFGAIRSTKLNRSARLQAGFSELELDILTRPHGASVE